MSANNSIKRIIGRTMMDLAQALETGRIEAIKIGLTTLGSEHGMQNLVKGAESAVRESRDFSVVLIGPKADSRLEIIEANSEPEMHKKMEELLDNGTIQACVTMHYNFPIGVSTVGRVITPGLGNDMYLASTTGTASAHRVEAMVKNAINGIITAKAAGIINPSVGIMGLDGARRAEKILRELNANGYAINYANSMRSDGGVIMRGNDLLTGAADVMVTDTLTGNIMMKLFSSFTTGGNYEALGYGYGPGIGENYNRIVLILSRASGSPVVANALKYAAQLVRGRLMEVARAEFDKVRKANFEGILKTLKEEGSKGSKDAMEATKPPKEVVNATIAGIDIMVLEEAVTCLWKEGIYAESGMGCTGPIVLVNENKLNEAVKLLNGLGFLVSSS